MKKVSILLLTFLMCFSCSEDLKFNTPALEGNKDGNAWKAKSFRATIDPSGELKIFGSDNFEFINITMPSADVGVYTQDNAEVNFTDIQEVFFSTDNDPDPSVQIYPADLEIILTEYNLASNTVSGSFHFNAFDPTGFSGVNFSEAFFHRVPVTGTADTGGGTGGGITQQCQIAQATVAATLINFNAVSATDPGYTAACTAYRTALEAQITACGDTTGVLQATIDGLGDCS